MEPELKYKGQNKGPYKKWTKDEEEKLLNFLRENQLFEKPTAQMFYRRFMYENDIESEWRLVRSKVRNLRVSFQKAKLWQDSTCAGALNEGETIKDVVLKKCPLFYELEQIFGYKEPTVYSAIIDTEMAVETNQIHRNIADNYEEVDSPDDFEPNFYEVNIPMTEPSAEVFPERSGTHESPLRTAQSDIMQFQAEVLAVKREKIATEIKLMEQVMQLQKEKFLSYKETRKKEIRLKEKEIQVRVLEIEMNERLGMKELELRKEIEMEKLKRAK